MLIVYSFLPIGGIETFFVRLAEYRASIGMTTSFLFVGDIAKSDEVLLKRLRAVAEVYTYDDIFLKSIWPRRAILLQTYNRDILKKILLAVKSVHVTCAEHGLLISQIMTEINIHKPVTVGVYHSQEFVWSWDRPPYSERLNRQYIFENLPAQNLFCFSQSTKEFIESRTAVDLSKAQTFRIGVVDSPRMIEKIYSKQMIRICIVGRLVKFKSYILAAVRAISELSDSGGLDVELDIYGEGPLRLDIEEVISLSGSKRVKLCGSFEYSVFDDVVGRYDLFLGSGTAIVQAASIGVPSIIGIESEVNFVSYGYFSEMYRLEYHRGNLAMPKRSILDIICEYSKLDDGKKLDLSTQHVEASKSFSIEECNTSMSNVEVYGIQEFPIVKKYKWILYYISKLVQIFKNRFFGFDIYSQSAPGEGK